MQEIAHNLQRMDVIDEVLQLKSELFIRLGIEYRPNMISGLREALKRSIKLQEELLHDFQLSSKENQLAEGKVIVRQTEEALEKFVEIEESLRKQWGNLNEDIKAINDKIEFRKQMFELMPRKIQEQKKLGKYQQLAEDIKFHIKNDQMPVIDKDKDNCSEIGKKIRNKMDEVRAHIDKMKKRKEQLIIKQKDIDKSISQTDNGIRRLTDKKKDHLMNSDKFLSQMPEKVIVSSSPTIQFTRQDPYEAEEYFVPGIITKHKTKLEEFKEFRYWIILLVIFTIVGWLWK